ncbi:MAG TPA: alpha-amylase family glycosyl hydrolase [Solirubrobacteraceae bacterium]|nr:alpha-amylase family glycosyl hydrolase [Solirubrobacteraceae bacterium]
MWWDDAVIYQVYLRSFQDSDGDGIGDLNGVTARLEHIARLGAAAVWLSPVYPSPNADFGYDVSDYQAIDPGFGTLADFDALVARAHELGLKVVLDYVPCHTSIEHPWFREHPDYYVWADEIPNNWRAAFGGPAWERDPQSGRYYLSSFFPEQADLNWRNPDVRTAMGEALRFWVDRGVDGFRVDALDRIMKDPELRDEPPASGPPALPLDPQDAELEHIYSRNAPDVGVALEAIRDAVGPTLLIGEVFLPTAQLGPYLEHLDVCFSFETLFAGGDAAALAEAIAAGISDGGLGWVLSNHDFDRLATRAGPGNARALALLLLTLPGPVFIYQGDELGMANSAPSAPALDRHGRDNLRMPMRWDESAHAGFTTGTPWLTTDEAEAPPVSIQEGDRSSTLALVRGAINVRGELDGPVAIDSPDDGLVVLVRGRHVTAVNLSGEPRPAPAAARVVLAARPGDGADLRIVPAHGGWVALRPD